jgi:hypothetical protein
MLVIKKLVIDLETGATLAREAFDYEGPVAQCGGGKGGRSSGSGGGQENSLTRQQADISQRLFDESTPLRQALTGAAESRLGMTPTFPQGAGMAGLFGPSAPERQAAESQYNVAKENIIGNTPNRGSDLNRALAGNENNRAAAITGLEADATNRALNLGSSVAFQAPGTALTGLSNATTHAATMANRQAQQDQAAGQAKGGLLFK